MSAVKSTIPDNISEEYYQISTEILSSFPKYRPPLDLFRFRDDIAQLQPLFRKGERLSNEQIEKLQELCAGGDLFVARSDRAVYSKHIVKQLDLVLVDENLKTGEVAEICIMALGQKLSDFFEQPVKPVFDALYRDTMVFTEYLWQDKHRIKSFMRRLNTEHTLVNHSLNTLFVGLWLLMDTDPTMKRRLVDRAALGLMLHDLGMAKIPAFILSKTTPLKMEEKDKIPPHPLMGAKIMHKLGLAFDEMRQAQMEHHERLDGSGYPQKLSGERISKLGRIAAIADSFAAMISKRPYAAAMDAMTAAAHLARNTKKYDAKYTARLQAAYVQKLFDTPGKA
ncbi:HD-GYP domain-containing protein [Oleidesulfovibrio sp.]|uniref:HD-GYP domain-containing protein n=1 Tax=Oleidesulfovibrio sp. TaxID=2909707 RepID=UPI003A8AADD1